MVTTVAGRPRDAARTREDITGAARALFAQHGYEGTTVRMVAAGAGITQGLITRYFGSKEGLFLAASDVSLHVAEAVAGPREHLGERLAAAIVGRWLERTTGDPLLILVRAAGSHPGAAAVLQDFLERESTGVITARLAADGMDPADARERALAVDAFVMGVVMARRVLVLFDHEGAEGLQRWMGRSLQALLDHGAP